MLHELNQYYVPDEVRKKAQCAQKSLEANKATMDLLELVKKQLEELPPVTTFEVVASKLASEENQAIISM